MTRSVLPVGLAILLIFSLGLVVGCGSGRSSPRVNRVRPKDDDVPQANTGPNKPTLPKNTSSAPEAPAASASVPVLPKAKPGGKKLAAASINVAIEPIPLDDSWTLEKKISQASVRMRVIMQAMRRYVNEHGEFPPAAYSGKDSRPLLSWRVLLLKYLEEERYNQFNYLEPWDSPANLAAASVIPSVYQSPLAPSDRTPFLVPSGPNTLFEGTVGFPIENATDNLATTFALIMVGDEDAVMWSKPEDLTAEKGSRLTGFLACFADGGVRWVPKDANRVAIASLFTPAGNETTKILDHTKAEHFAAKLLGEDTRSESPPPEEVAVATPEKPETPTAPSPTTPAVKPPPRPGRKPIPDAETLKTVKAKLREIYKDQLPASGPDSKKEKYQFARKLMEQSSATDGEPDAHYFLLDLVRKYAVECGDYKLAMQAVDKLSETFEVDDDELRRRTLVDASKEIMPYFSAQNKDVINDSVQFLRRSVEQDNFDAAMEMFDVMKDAIKRNESAGNSAPARRNPSLARMLPQVEKELDQLRKAYVGVPAAQEILVKTPDDSDARLAVGTYLALVKFDWARGLPHLVAQSSDVRLNVLASLDKKGPANGTAMASLANEYWIYSEKTTGLKKRGLQLRAVYWYGLARDKLQSGLALLEADKRIYEVREAYGDFVVQRALDNMPGSVPVEQAAGVAKAPATKAAAGKSSYKDEGPLEIE